MARVPVPVDQITQNTLTGRLREETRISVVSGETQVETLAGSVEEEGAGRHLGAEGVVSRAFVGDPGGGQAGTTEAGVGGSGDGDTETGSDIALDGGVGLLPFVSKCRGYAVENCFGLGAVKPITGYNEGGEVTALVHAFLEVLALLFFLMFSQSREWFGEALGRSI